MKKPAAFILIFIYFIFSTGFVVSVHYCMNKIDSVQLGDSKNDECGKCGMHMEESNGCCKDDVKVVKVHVDQAIAKIFSPNFELHLVASILTDKFLAPLGTVARKDYPLAHGPPLNGRDIHLKNCVFRI